MRFNPPWNACVRALELWYVCVLISIMACGTISFAVLTQCEFSVDLKWIPQIGSPPVGLAVVAGISVLALLLSASGWLVRVFQLNRLLWLELLPPEKTRYATWLAVAALIAPGNLAMPVVLTSRLARELPEWRGRWFAVGVAWFAWVALLMLFWYPWIGLWIFFTVRLLTCVFLAAAGGRWHSRHDAEAAPFLPRWRNLHRTVCGMLLGIFLVILLIWSVFAYHASRVNHEAELKLTTLHVPMTPAQFRRQSPDLAATPDGYELWQWLQLDWPDTNILKRQGLPFETIFDRLDPLNIPGETPLPPEAVALLPQLWEERQETIKLLEQLPKYPTCDFRRQWERGLMMPLPELGMLRRLAKFQRFRILRALERRDRAEIRAIWEQCGILADWAQQDGSLLSMLLSHAMNVIEISTYESALQQLEFPDTELRQLLTRLTLRERSIPADLRRTLEAENIAYEVTTSDLYRIFLRFSPAFPLKPVMQWNQAFIREKMAELIRVAAQPPWQVREKLEDFGNYPDTLFTVLAHMLLPALPNYVTSVYTHIALLRCVRTALAAELYRRQHGKWPENAAELVPEFLDELPLDPFTGETLHLQRGDLIYDRPQYQVKTEGGQTIFSTEYKRETRPGFRVYSNGPDWDDDNGLPRNSYFKQGKNYDIAFSLYDVNGI